MAHAKPATITRFAPSPTGELHIGHAYAALFAWAQARRDANGRFLLRFEDIDRTRCQTFYEDGIVEDLLWLGLTWERPSRRQSAHFPDYAAALARLEGMGLIYPCFCTRRAIQDEIARANNAPHGPDGPLYPGTCRHLSAAERNDLMEQGAAYGLRLDMEKALAQASAMTFFDRAHGLIAARPGQFGDVVLARKDIPASYHLCATLDDHIQGITLVTRGDDLLPATHLHRLLQALLGLDTPDYHHHELLTDAQGKKFSKRDRSVTLRALRDMGKSPQEVRRMAGAGHLMG